MESKATSTWSGTLKEGKGSISTASGALKDTGYSFQTRFEGKPGTNPEELVAAAHSACFSMAMSAELEKQKIVSNSIETSATVVLAKQGEGFAVTESRLRCTIKAPISEQDKIEKAAAATKENCPISKLLNARITLELTIQEI